MARTDCRPTLGIDEALARIEHIEEGADILFLDLPANEDEAVAPSKPPPGNRPSRSFRQGPNAKHRTSNERKNSAQRSAPIQLA